MDSSKNIFEIWLKLVKMTQSYNDSNDSITIKQLFIVIWITTDELYTYFIKKKEKKMECTQKLCNNFFLVKSKNSRGVSSAFIKNIKRLTSVSCLIKHSESKKGDKDHNHQCFNHVYHS